MHFRINQEQPEIWHCCYHEDANQPEIREAIEKLCREHHTNFVNSGACSECLEKIYTELEELKK